MMQGMMFGGEGPVMQGTWYNPSTGDAFTVRDSFFEDNQYVVTTTDGRYLQYSQLQNYIQSDMKLEELKQLKLKKTTPKKEEIPSEVASLITGNEDPYADMILPDDDALIRKQVLGNINEKHISSAYLHQRPQEIPISETNMNFTIIEKALKNASKPSFEVNVEWNDYPSKQIEMLKDVMEIPEDEIIEWFLNNIQLDEVVNKIKDAIKNRLQSPQWIKLMPQEGELLHVIEAEPINGLKKCEYGCGSEPVLCASDQKPYHTLDTSDTVHMEQKPKETKKTTKKPGRPSKK